jgi:hypothetical protein
MSLLAIPTPSLPSVPSSTLLAWHIRELRGWGISCAEPEALASGVVEWVDLGQRIDLASMTKAPVKRVLFLGQTLDGVVFGFFANCPLSGAVRGRDPTLKSAIFVLEHPTGGQRKWQLQSPNCEIDASDEFLQFGTGLSLHSGGTLCIECAPEFGMTQEDASFISLEPAGDDGLSISVVRRWELWGV